MRTLALLFFSFFLIFGLLHASPYNGSRRRERLEQKQKRAAVNLKQAYLKLVAKSDILCFLDDALVDMKEGEAFPIGPGLHTLKFVRKGLEPEVKKILAVAGKVTVIRVEEIFKSE